MDKPRIIFITNTLSRTAAAYLEKLLAVGACVSAVILVSQSYKYTNNKAKIRQALRRYSFSACLARVLKECHIKLRYLFAKFFPIPLKEGGFLSTEEFLLVYNLPAIRINDINSPQSQEKIRMLAPDIIFVSTLNQIISRETLDVVKNGWINIHAGILPQYRGPASNFWVLYNQERTTGVTFHYMEAKPDAGKIIKIENMNVLPTDTEDILDLRLSQAGKDAIPEVLELIGKGQSYTPEAASSRYWHQPGRRERRLLRHRRRQDTLPGPWTHSVRLAAFDACLRRQGRLLEAGCGECLFAADIARVNKKLDIFAVDNDKNMLRQAEEMYLPHTRNLHVKQGLLEALPFDDEYFDHTVCINTLVNTGSQDELERIIREITRTLKHKGRFIFDFRNGANPLVLLKYKIAPLHDKTLKKKNIALRAWRPKTIGHIMAQNGLEIINRRWLTFPYNGTAAVILMEAEKC